MSGATKGNSLGASALLQPTYVKDIAHNTCVRVIVHVCAPDYPAT